MAAETSTKGQNRRSSKEGTTRSHNDDNIKASEKVLSASVLADAARVSVLDAEGRERQFEDIYKPFDIGGKKRTLIIFVRHFFCGNCQEYISALASSIPSPSLLPPDTSVAIVGCGAPSLIAMYTDVTHCPFPIYTDPSSRLYSLFGMTRTLDRGTYVPEHNQASLATLVLRGITQGLKRLFAGDMLKSGAMQQNGGELLFEAEFADATNSNDDRIKVNVPFCNIMQTTRDHSEISVLRAILGLDEKEQ
ncbi:hypothetical protein AJ79_05075 [Helicocarpus griseus UAMH5409]|uniref:Thioredoxin-like fold domain-containing protein n=1 Tax=Helicocarpus griseus UAMH5409 TaxID=1447875 RepID=A0A2B7XR91_9EURO|nr:hypothetical protein AJ79_05075 [Helicocarpus griseus UAMH5409]